LYSDTNKENKSALNEEDFERRADDIAAAEPLPPVEPLVV